MTSYDCQTSQTPIALLFIGSLAAAEFTVAFLGPWRMMFTGSYWVTPLEVCDWYANRNANRSYRQKAWLGMVGMLSPEWSSYLSDGFWHWLYHIHIQPWWTNDYPIIPSSSHHLTILRIHKCKEKPIGSMYAIYGNIYHQYTPNVGIYTIHGSYGKTSDLIFLWKAQGRFNHDLWDSDPMSSLDNHSD